LSKANAIVNKAGNCSCYDVASPPIPQPASHAEAESIPQNVKQSDECQALMASTIWTWGTSKIARTAIISISFTWWETLTQTRFYKELINCDFLPFSLECAAVSLAESYSSSAMCCVYRSAENQAP